MLLKSRPTSTSRRICVSQHHKGPRWIHTLYFNPKTRYPPAGPYGDNEDLPPKSFQSWCKTCQLLHHRARHNYTPKPRQPKRTEEQKRQAQRESYHRRMQDPEYREHRRQYQRENRKKREAARQALLNDPTPTLTPTSLPSIKPGRPPSPPPFITDSPPIEKRVNLPAAPLLTYLDKHVPNYRQLLPENLNRRIRESRKTQKIELGALDSILMELQSPHLLHELYPLD